MMQKLKVFNVTTLKFLRRTKLEYIQLLVFYNIDSYLRYVIYPTSPAVSSSSEITFSYKKNLVYKN